MPGIPQSMASDATRSLPVEADVYMATVNEYAGAMKKRLPVGVPAVGVILGKGCEGLLEWMVAEDTKQSNAPVETAMSAHLDIGYLGSIPCLFAKGAPYIKGARSMQEVALPVRVMGTLGVKVLVVVNTSCSVNPGIAAGDMCLVSDHINYLGNSPLVGHNQEEWGPRFPDMTEPYSVSMIRQCLAFGSQKGIKIREGVYVSVSEHQLSGMQKTEYEYLRLIGADLVGADTVPEVIAARHMGLKVVGISCVNDTCGVDSDPSETQESSTTRQNQKPVLVDTLIKAIASFN